MPNYANGGRIYALDFLNTEGGKALLLQRYGEVMQNLQGSLISTRIKNKNLSGDMAAGSVEAKRFSNSNSKPYGTAAAAGHGDAIQSKPVVVQFDQHEEIIEELQKFDAETFGVPNLINRRTLNHSLTMQRVLEEAFFACAFAASNAFTTTSTNVEDILEEVIQKICTTKNEFVQGVPRDLIHIAASPKFYGKIRNYLDKIVNTNVDTTKEEFYAFHKVQVEESIFLPDGVEFIAQVKESVAQPVRVDVYDANRIQFSNRWSLDLFYDFGTKAVAPDLIWSYATPQVDIDADIATTTDLLGKYVTDLQSGVTIEDNTVFGAVKYVTGYTGYSGVTEEQEGNYLALHFSATTGATIQVKLVGGPLGFQTLDSDGLVICRLANNNPSIIAKASLDGVTVTKEYSLKNLVLIGK